MAFATAAAVVPSGRRALACERAARATRRAPLRRAPAPRMLVIAAKSTTDFDKILSSADGALVVVDYSTTWCGPCKAIAPAFEALSEKHTDVVFVKVMGDADAASGELMKREGIRAVPAFHFWKAEEKVHTFVGAKTEEIESSIEEHK